MADPCSRPKPGVSVQGTATIFEIAAHRELEALALAWTVRNRQVHLEALKGRMPAEPRAPEPFGLPDPTCGATHFHRHDEPPPPWAISEPIALIGDYLFYDLRGASRHL